MQRERKMKLRHAAAMLLSAWLLMTPPPVKDTPVVDVTAPFSRWSSWPTPHTTYNTKHDCEESRRKQCQSWLAGSGVPQASGLRGVPYQWPQQAILMTAVSICTSVCLSSDDPRLKKN